MSDPTTYLEPAICPLCGRPTLVFRFGRMRCTSDDCDFCQYCKGPCQSGTASGCAGAEGPPGLTSEDAFEVLKEIRSITLQKHLTFPAYLAAMAKIRELCETFVPKD